MGIQVSIATGRFTAGRVDAVYAPTQAKAGPVVVYLHSAAGFNSESHPTSAFTGIQAHIRNIVDNFGWTVVCPTQPIGFGNGAASDTGTGTCQGALTDAIAYHRANLYGTNAPVVLLGTSMGSTTALRRCGLAPSTVACAVTFCSAPDLTIAYIDAAFDPIGVQIAGAYSFTPSAPTRLAADLPALTCPTHQMSDSVPKLITHANNDVYTTTPGHVVETEWATGRGASFLDTGAQGHTNASVLAVPLDTVTGFIAQHAS